LTSKRKSSWRVRYGKEESSKENRTIFKEEEEEKEVMLPGERVLKILP
jgi:hypothetical protein